jgi:hypothetical protein
MIKLVKGNSWWRDYSSNVTAAFTADWATSSWAIAAADADFVAVAPYTALSSGVMTISATTTHLQVRIPSASTMLDPGNYVIALQFKNTVTGFCQEQHLALTIFPQVIT